MANRFAEGKDIFTNLPLRHDEDIEDWVLFQLELENIRKRDDHVVR